MEPVHDHLRYYINFAKRSHQLLLSECYYVIASCTLYPCIKYNFSNYAMIDHEIFACEVVIYGFANRS